MKGVRKFDLFDLYDYLSLKYFVGSCLMIKIYNFSIHL